MTKKFLQLSGEKSEQELKVGTEGEPWKNVIYYVAPMAYSVCTQDHQSWEGNTHSKLGPSTSTIHRENAPQGYLQANYVEAFCFN